MRPAHPGESGPRVTRPWRAGTIAGLLLTLAAMPGLAAAQTTATQATDPVVVDVVRMLEVGIEPELILNWLQSSGKRPGPLSADDVIALAEVKAPKPLIQALLDLATPVARAPAAPVTPAPGAAATPTAPAPIAPAPVPPATAAGDRDCCLIDFSVEYRATEDRVGAEFEGPGHDLFLYLDGKFLARFESQGNIAAQGPIPFKARVAPGDHTIRLTRELHTRPDASKRPDEWDHLTTVSPAAIDFRVEPGADWNMDIRWVQGEFSLKKPLHWRWSRDGVEVAGQEHAGEFREDWPYLCDDVEASRNAGAISGWRARDRMKGCVSWASLWPKTVVITRGEVLAELRQSDFEPAITAVGRID
jgi:hypothetical protein